MKKSKLVVKKGVVEVTLKLTKKEARLLHILLGQCFGKGDVRSLSEVIYKKLSYLGFKFNKQNTGRDISEIDLNNVNLDHCKLTIKD